MAVMKDLLQVQIGKETARGTAATPTAKLMFVEQPTIRPIVEAVNLAQAGSLAPGQETALTRVAAEASVEGHVLYEDIVYWLDALLGEATPTGTGPYTYDHAAPSTSQPSPRILTMVHGNGSDVYQATGLVGRSLTISGATGEPLKFSTDLVGYDAGTGTLAALSDRTVTPVMGDHVALYIDAFGGTIGSTAISSTFFSFELSVDAARDNVHGLGSLKPATYREQRWSGMLRMSLEFDATTKAYLDAILGASAVFERLVRIKAASGSNVFQIDFAGFAESAPEVFTDEDGVVTVDLELTGTYEAGLGNWLKFQTVNGVSAMP